MWIVFAAASGFFYTLLSLLSRYLLKGDNKDPWAFSFYFSLVGTLVSLFFVPFEFEGNEFKISLIPLGLLIGILIIIHNLLRFTADKLVSASVSGSLMKLRSIITFLIAIIFLDEDINKYKIAGVICTFLAGIILVGSFRGKKSLKGIVFVILSTFLYSIVFVLSKYILEFLNPAFFTAFIIFLGPTILNFLFMPRRVQRISKLWKLEGKEVLIATSLGALANLTTAFALKVNNSEATKVLVIIEVFLILVLSGEIIFLKEKEYLINKVIAVIFAILGGIFILL